MALWISVLSVRRLISPAPLPVISLGGAEEDRRRAEIEAAARRGKFQAEDVADRRPTTRARVYSALKTGRASLIGSKRDDGTILVRVVESESVPAALDALLDGYPVGRANLAKTLGRLGSSGQRLDGIGVECFYLIEFERTKQTVRT